jgi:hypothetical protein
MENNEREAHEQKDSRCFASNAFTQIYLSLSLFFFLRLRASKRARFEWCGGAEEEGIKINRHGLHRHFSPLLFQHFNSSLLRLFSETASS